MPQTLLVCAFVFVCVCGVTLVLITGLKLVVGSSLEMRRHQKKVGLKYITIKKYMYEVFWTVSVFYSITC